MEYKSCFFLSLVYDAAVALPVLVPCSDLDVVDNFLFCKMLTKNREQIPEQIQDSCVRSGDSDILLLTHTHTYTPGVFLKTAVNMSTAVIYQSLSSPSSFPLPHLGTSSAVLSLAMLWRCRH